MHARQEVGQMTDSPTSTLSFKRRLGSSQRCRALSESQYQPWWCCVEVAQMITQALEPNNSHFFPHIQWAWNLLLSLRYQLLPG